MNNETTSRIQDDDNPNLYEKWLRSRLNQAVLRETGRPSNPGFIDAVVTAGDCKHEAQTFLRNELWVGCRYPHSDFFGNKMVAYNFPFAVSEILDLRFGRHLFEEPKDEPKFKNFNPVCDISIGEMATIASWGAGYFPMGNKEPPKQSGVAECQLYQEFPEPPERPPVSASPPEQTTSTPAECLHLLPNFKLGALRQPKVKRRR
ncbi:hypothetical protein EGW08_000944 [Elysia chlorotica]|uniref:Uncharacterized protein n=1 Tax=Elysia chlorotica TaxID=188477 RepID=A0A433UBS3_ELYCH|nr:hypothetical protein EGW08_000944 [Elysia chlorotica]